MHAGEYHAAGVSFPGMPGVAIGRTNTTAWSITNSKIDSADWFLERVRGNEVEKDGKWVKMQKRTEYIKVRGGDPVEFNVYSTEHGLGIECPVFRGIENYSMIQKIVPNLFNVNLENFSWCWALAHKEDKSIQVVLGMPLTKSVDEFFSLFDDYSGGSYSLLWSSEDEDGYLAPGLYPKRKSGKYVKKGWESANDWEAWHSPKETPRVKNSKRGFYFTTNNKITSENHFTDIGTGIGINSRAIRINELIEEKVRRGEKVSGEDA